MTWYKVSCFIINRTIMLKRFEMKKEAPRRI